MAADGSCANPTPELKRERLVEAFGEKGFDYVASGSGDLAVWCAARKAVLINPSVQLLRSTLGFVPRYSNQDALLRNYDWYAAHRNECKGNTGISHCVAWKKGLLQFAKWFF